MQVWGLEMGLFGKQLRTRLRRQSLLYSPLGLQPATRSSLLRIESVTLRQHLLSSSLEDPRTPPAARGADRVASTRRQGGARSHSHGGLAELLLRRRELLRGQAAPSRGHRHDARRVDAARRATEPSRRRGQWGESCMQQEDEEPQPRPCYPSAGHACSNDAHTSPPPRVFCRYTLPWSGSRTRLPASMASDVLCAQAGLCFHSQLQACP
jgi:hypothetical protein